MLLILDVNFSTFIFYKIGINNIIFSRSLIVSEDEEEEILKFFGYKEFKSSHQRQAIVDCLALENTAVCLPTGAGKSLIPLFVAKANPQKRYILVVPLKALLEQWKGMKIPTNLNLMSADAIQRSTLPEDAERVFLDEAHLFLPKDGFRGHLVFNLATQSFLTLMSATLTPDMIETVQNVC